MKVLGLRSISFVDWNRSRQSCTRTTAILLLSATMLSSGYATQSGCSFKIETEFGRQVAVASAQPLYKNGQIQFRISQGTSGVELEIRFKPGDRFKPRFSPAEVIRQLDDAQAGAELMQIKQRESLSRVKGWTHLSGAYAATFSLPEVFFARIGTGFLDFGLDLPNAFNDLHPSGFADTTGCASLMQRLKK